MDLREPGRVLLVSTYEMGHQPLGLASPLGFLRRAGYAAAAIDLATDKLDPALVEQAAFVGFSVPMHTAMRIALRAAARVRAQKPSVHICFYGLYAPLQVELLRSPMTPLTVTGGGEPEGADETRRPLADSVLGGEYEEALLEQIEALSSGTRVSPVPPPVLRRLPFVKPERGALRPLGQYARLVRDGGEVAAGYTEATRGCLHRCRHCPIPAVYDGRFFAIPVDVVLADIRTQVAAGARHITLGDPDFLNGPGHAMAVARALHREFPSLSFDITVKVEHILGRAALFPELAALGCLFVTTAVESLSERVLAILDKGHDRKGVEAAIRIVRRAGITLRPTWVPFTPWSTLDEHLELLSFLEDEGLRGAVDPVQLIIRLLLPPGSLLLAHPEMQAHLGPLDATTLSYAWTHPDPRMDALQRASAKRVALGETEKEDPRDTWLALNELAYAMAGRALPKPKHAISPEVGFPTEGGPKLTESWFC